MALGLAFLVCPIAACGEMGDSLSDPAALGEQQAELIDSNWREVHAPPARSVMLPHLAPPTPLPPGDHPRHWDRDYGAIPFGPLDRLDHPRHWAVGATAVPFMRLDPAASARPWSHGEVYAPGTFGRPDKWTYPRPRRPGDVVIEFPDEVVIAGPRLPAGAGAGAGSGRDLKLPPPPPCISCPPERAFAVEPAAELP